MDIKSKDNAFGCRTNCSSDSQPCPSSPYARPAGKREERQFRPFRDRIKCLIAFVALTEKAGRPDCLQFHYFTHHLPDKDLGYKAMWCTVTRTFSTIRSTVKIDVTIVAEEVELNRCEEGKECQGLRGSSRAHITRKRVTSLAHGIFNFIPQRPFVRELAGTINFSAS